MKILIPQENLAGALTTVSKAVSSKNTIPVLSGIYLAAQGDRLTLRATDLELAIECTVPAQVAQEGAIVLPARYLTELVRRIPFGEIDLSVDARNFTATVRWEKSRYTIHGFQPDQFPYLPEADGEAVLSLQQSTLRHMLRQTTFAASHDETRPYLTGVYFSNRGEMLQALATDGVRIAASIGAYTGGEGKVSGIIPSRTLNELVRLLSGEDKEEVQVTFTASRAFFTLPSLRVISRLLEGQYPDVMRLVPQSYQTRVNLSRTSFLDACERAALITKDGAIKIGLGQEALTITANAAEVGQVYEELPTSLQGDALEIGFNSRYLIEGLRAIDSAEFSFEFAGSRNPSRIRSTEGEDFTYIVLPLITY